MGAITDIAWCDSTLNLQMGCSGCELWNPAKGIRKCYAGLMTEKFLVNGPISGWPETFTKPKVFPERMKYAEQWRDLTGTERPSKPWLNHLPRVIFLNDMGDTFAKGMDINWLAPFLPRMAATHHYYLLLTKRGTMLRKFFDQHECPTNMGCGVSITKQDCLTRINELVETKTLMRFLSIEPLWEKVDLRQWLWTGTQPARKIHWAIIGGESGINARETVVQDLEDAAYQCVPADVKVFVKQLGSNPMVSWPMAGNDGAAALVNARKPGRIAPDLPPFKHPKGGDWNEWPHNLRIRQMPSLSGKQQVFNLWK